MSRYERDAELEELMQRVINTEPELSHPNPPDVMIACQWCDAAKKAKGAKVYADTTVIADKVKRLAGFDFVITFYKPHCEKLDEEHMMRLMYHELLHVGHDDTKFFIVPHDLEDFHECISRWGVDWIKG